MMPQATEQYVQVLRVSVVRASLNVERSGHHRRPLRLDGDSLDLLALKVDGVTSEPRFEGDQLVLDLPGDRATIETEVAITPPPTAS